SQLPQLELSESEVTPSKLQAKFQYYLQAVARRCSALSEVPEFMKNSITLQEDLHDEADITQTALGVYEIDIDEECPKDELEQEEEDPASQYVSGVKRFDEPTSAVEEPTKEINLGTKADPRIILVSANLSQEEEEVIVEVLREYKDSFAWTYEDMPGLDPELVEHHLPLKPGAKAVKQKLRRYHPRTALQIKQEIDKLHTAKFIRVILYPMWVANIVPVIKKNGRSEFALTSET